MNPKNQYKLMDIDKVTWLVEDGHMSMACYEMFNEAMEADKAKPNKGKDADKPGPPEKPPPASANEDVEASWCLTSTLVIIPVPFFPLSCLRF